MTPATTSTTQTRHDLMGTGAMFDDAASIGLPVQPRRAGVSNLLGATVIVGLTLLCYWPALRGDFIWDDDRHVSENRMLRSADGLRRIWLEPGVTPQYYPMTHTSFWVEQRLWGLNPLGYHVTNVLLHSINALLLWRLLARLDVPGAWLAAAIFAWHPVNVESVAWISERKNVLAMMFMLLSILAYLREGLASYFLSFALFACALLSKTITCSMPAVVLLILWWKNRASWLDVAKLFPFFVLGLVMGLITAGMETSHVGAAGPDWELTLAQRVITAGRAVWFYFGKLIWPVNLTFSYPRWEIDGRVWWQWIFPVAATVLVLMLWLNRKRTRGPLVAVLIYIGTLFPALGFFDTYPMRYSFVADHFQYLSAPAMIALLVAGAMHAVARWRMRQPGIDAARVRIVTVNIAIVLAVLVTLTYRQSRIYASAETIWRDTIAKNPDSWMARSNLAVVLTAQAGVVGDADAKLNEALALLDDVERLRPQHEKLESNRVEALVKLGRTDEALAILSARASRDPHDPRPLVRIGIIRGQLGDMPGAIEMFRRAIALDSTAADAHLNLARALESADRFDEAVEAYHRALALRPADHLARLSLANLLYRPQVNRMAESAAQFQSYLEAEPEDAAARAALGFVYGEMGRYDDAAREFRHALRIDPDQRVAREGLRRIASIKK